MKNTKKRISLFLTCCVAVLLLAFSPCGNVQAASASSKAKKAYASYLSRHTSSIFSKPGYMDAAYKNPESDKSISCYAVTDLKGSSVPELIAVRYENFRSYTLNFYEYKNGKVRQFGKTIYCSSTANGGYTYYVCRKEHLHVIWRGAPGSETSIYQFTASGKMKLIAKAEIIDWVNLKSYQMNGKKVSAAKYKKSYGKCQYKKLTAYKNTASNRKKLK